jgi:hypothetical protein
MNEEGLSLISQVFNTFEIKESNVLPDFFYSVNF